ncbi:hypothetical protein [Desulfopila sp. IMCC35006]|uniref:hypothetical protein n=1 Tax=Desulfopila sp. IMCC35006 TaxID=2569542 RepID=UPI00197AE549|nr:hypothetical protein [Desulfopila sp. IMCC35006]
MKEFDKPKEASPSGEVIILGENRVHRILVLLLLLLMVVEWIVLLIDQRWLSSFLATLTIATLVSPVIFRHKMEMEIPAEFHITAVVFIFASLYLGEIQGFYHRFWWWDLVLHSSAGLLMGIVGFFLVYTLNESKRVDLHMTPIFISLFACLFAVAIGTFWEIFEFSMDRLIGSNMQKPMLDDPSGLTDTMWDMIVNAIGAIIISSLGWWYMKRKRTFFVREWIRTFIRRNPEIFNKS